MKPTLVIGDVHGHLDRLAALLEQEGIVRDKGNGEWERINHDVEVVQLGDLGHFGDGSPTGDLLCYEYAKDWIDVLLWGNHDRAVIDSWHAFRGYTKPRPEVYHLMKLYEHEGKLRWAVARHGHLITHAGLHRRFHYNKPPIDKTNPEDVAQWINGALTGEDDQDRAAVRHAISRRRGGSSSAGGILWRDIDESLYDRFPQVFGHSADHKNHAIRYVWGKGHTRKLEHVPEHVENLSYCIDVGGKGDLPSDDCLAGIYLPEGRIVRVDL
jgi:hypothetical protein